MPPKPPRIKVVKTDYCDNVIYQDGKLSQILVDGGYITFSGTTPVYHYYLKDHLGNNRVVAKQDGTAEQVNHYYPFGGLMAESTGGDIQRYKYNGKELDRMFGLDWYDYGARHYDGARAQFTTFDPLAEKDYGTSPYAYCGNAPMIRVDKDGRIWDTVIDVAFVAYDLADAGTQYLNTGSVSSTTKAALAADALAAVIPGVTGAGIAVRAGEKAAAKTVEASKGAEKVLQTQAKSSRAEKLRESAEIGQEAHRQIEKELCDGFGSKSEVRLELPNKTVRKDAQLPDGKYVIIKPNTKSGHKAAESRQKLLERNNKETIIIYYDPHNPAYRPGSPSYIGPHKK
ncbi:MAG: RHS repeat-associated core domain-containing protein [Prevotella sp.]|nr:RHS repeat-associated core domain-containing protein [Prevotella sp.]